MGHRLVPVFAAPNGFTMAIDMKRIHFIGVGAPKAGSTLLATNLFTRLGVLSPLCSNQKEVNYFTYRYEHYKNGDVWYQSQFQKCGLGEITGEFSPSYFSDPASPSLISAFSRDVKIIVIVRNPVDRMFSSYQAQKRSGRIALDLPFEQALSQHEILLNDSRYALHLKRYRKYFSQDNIHLVIMENLIKDPAKELNDIMGFLGVGLTFPGDYCLERINVGWLPRNRILHAMSQGLRIFGRCFVPKSIYGSRTALQIKESLLSINKGQKELLDPGLHAELMVEFKEDNLELARMFGADAPFWTQK